MAHPQENPIGNPVILSADKNHTTWASGRGFHGPLDKGWAEVGLYQRNFPGPEETTEPRILVDIWALLREDWMHLEGDPRFGDHANAVRVARQLNTTEYNIQPGFGESRLAVYRLPVHCYYRIVADPASLVHGRTCKVQLL